MNKEQKKFLESGVVEDYCLGTATLEDVTRLQSLCNQFAEAQAYLEKNQKAMEELIGKFSRKPSDHSKNIINKNILENLKLESASLIGDEQLLPEFIGISRHSNIDHWDALVKEITPPSDFENIYAKPLFVSTTQELILVWAKNIVPDEVHDDLTESFLLLEGTADCYVDDEVFSMVKGDFMEIPLHSNHKVVVTSASPGKAIRSRVLV